MAVVVVAGGVTLVPVAQAATASNVASSGGVSAGDVFIADANNNRVVKVPAGGGGQTTVGTGLSSPSGVAVDAAGDVFIADAGNGQVVEVPAGGGAQTTVSTGLSNPHGVAVDAAGDVFIAETYKNRVVEVPAAGGGQTTVGTGLHFPTGVAVDATGDVFIADTGNNRVVEVPAAGGAQTTVGTGLGDPFGVAVDAMGDVFIADAANGQVVKVPAGGGAQTTVGTGLSDPEGVAVDAAGDVFIAETYSSRVVEVPAGGGAQTTVGTGLSYPEGVAVVAAPPTFTDSSPGTNAAIGTAYSYTYTASTPAGEPAAQFRISSGTLPPGLTLNTTTGVLSGTPTTAGSYTFTAETNNAATGTLAAPVTITVSSPGATFIADTFNGRVVEVPAGAGAQTTIGTGLSYPSGVAVDAAGDVFIADTYHDRVLEMPAGGGAQTTLGTGLSRPSGVGVDAAGDVFIADSGHDRVVEVPAGGGAQTTVGTGLSDPEGVAVDAAGDVFIADAGHSRVVEVPAGGGAQTKIGTGLSNPKGVAVDATGDVFIADYALNRVVKVPAGGGAQTTIGTGLFVPSGVAVDAAGGVVIADTDNDRVVEVPAGGGSQTTAGTGLNTPFGVAVSAPPPVFTASSPGAHAAVGTTYSYTYAASTPVGEPAAQFRVSSGTLPPGLTLNSTTGVLSGAPTKAGSYTFTAETNNAATGTLAAPVTITVAKAGQSITFTSSAPADAVVGGSYSPTASGGGSAAPVVFSVDASSSPGTCSYDSSTGTVSFAHVGTCVVDANQAGDADHDAAPQAQQSISVGKAAQSITFTSSAPTDAVVGGSYPIAASATSGLPVAFSIYTAKSSSATSCSVSGSTVTFAHVGTCVVDANQAGDADHDAAPTVSQSIVVGKATQTVTFAPLSSPAAAGSTQTLSAVGGASGNPVVFTVSTASGSVCSISGSTLSLDHVGTCVVDADQAGDADYTAAPQMQQSVSVTAQPTTATLTLNPASTVYGQDATATATVTAAVPGSVQFSVDGTPLGTPVTVTQASDGSSASAVSPPLGALAPGAHPVGATFTPSDGSVYASADALPQTLTVTKAATSTTVAVTARTLTASVGALAPGSGTPTGTVTFSVAGTIVGTATLSDGHASLAYTVAHGTTSQVAAAYSGDDDFMASSASTARQDPTITARITSAHAKTRYGWYRSPVTVTFTCTTHGAALTAPCPTPVILAKQGAGRSVARTITATDGGTATATVTGINIDRTAPTVTITGARNGGTYPGSTPPVRCSGRDALSGIATCTLSETRRNVTNGVQVEYRAIATDKAGNTATSTGYFTIRTLYIQGTTYRDGAYDITPGHTYTLVVTGTVHRPVYYDAAPYPQTPRPKDTAFHHTGRTTWALAVTFTTNLTSHHYWNIGIKIGTTLHTLTIRIT